MRLLTWCNLPNGERYEVLQCLAYGQPSRYSVDFLKDGVIVNRHSHDAEIAARTDFERLVEEKTGADYSETFIIELTDEELDRYDCVS